MQDHLRPITIKSKRGCLRFAAVFSLWVGSIAPTAWAQSTPPVELPSQTPPIEDAAASLPKEALKCLGQGEEGRTERSPFGTVLKFACYKNGELNGQFMSWYEDGKLKQKGFMRAGHMVGRWTRWHANGKIQDRINWVNGKPQGKFRSYHPNGKTAILGEFKLGLKDGLWTEFDEQGRVQSKGRFLCDGKIGDWIEWDEEAEKSRAVEHPPVTPCSTFDRFDLLSFEAAGTLGFQTNFNWSGSFMLGWTPRFRITQNWAIGLFFGLRPERARFSEKDTFMATRALLRLEWNIMGSRRWIADLGFGGEGWGKDGEGGGLFRGAAHYVLDEPKFKVIDRFIASVSYMKYQPRSIIVTTLGAGIDL